jgi:hypothetical protein
VVADLLAKLVLLREGREGEEKRSAFCQEREGRKRIKIKINNIFKESRELNRCFC